MTSVFWTYLWTGAAALSVIVRAIVLRLNVRDFRLLRRTDIAASRIMRRIQAGHLRISIVLAFISLCNVTIGVSAIVLKYHPSVPSWYPVAVGYFFIGYFILSEILLTLLAWFDLRMRRTSNQ